MNQLFQDSVFFGVLISLAAYGIGMLLKLKTGWSLMNPLLISIILVIITLLLTGVDDLFGGRQQHQLSAHTSHHLSGCATLSAG